MKRLTSNYFCNNYNSTEKKTPHRLLLLEPFISHLSAARYPYDVIETGTFPCTLIVPLKPTGHHKRSKNARDEALTAWADMMRMFLTSEESWWPMRGAFPPD